MKSLLIEIHVLVIMMFFFLELITFLLETLQHQSINQYDAKMFYKLTLTIKPTVSNRMKVRTQAGTQMLRF